MLKLTDVDEVYLALDQARTAFERDGHVPNEVPQNCMSCFALHLVIRGLEVYRARPNQVS